jgi:hypothetical protein
MGLAVSILTQLPLMGRRTLKERYGGSEDFDYGKGVVGREWREHEKAQG